MAVRPGLGKRRNSGPFLSVAVLGLMLASGSAISSESVDEKPETAKPEVSEINTFLERKTEREEELAALSRDIDVSSDRQAAIAREIRGLDRDRETLNAKIISTSDTIKGLETELTDTERRLMSLGENEDAVRLSLIARRDILAEVLAALQRLGKRPPPALAVRPSDALSAVRSAILLNAVMPELKVETEALAADLQELQRLKSVIAEEKTGFAATRCDWLRKSPAWNFY
ncbi:hypothetical protein [Labrenzia sp. DG1229]|uniref:murein hydrolase activator EnvC family protein n=1 Tax=Labrenzia sp. DG1229 TaxID=681847 RepID=UPI001AD946C3|nr:hypothetical protein [Labrenzia sp. DG1229]